MKTEELKTALGIPAGGTTEVSPENFALYAKQCVESGAPLVFMYATDEREGRGVFVVHAVYAAKDGFLTLASAVPQDKPAYPSLTREIMAAHWFERLIHDQFGIVAQGHPDWRRLIHHENIPAGTYPLRKDFAWNTKLAHAHEPYPMHRVEGKGIYEIPVGPIHAGIIEPGHFRFNVRGERIITLEGKLFFKTQRSREACGREDAAGSTALYRADFRRYGGGTYARLCASRRARVRYGRTRTRACAARRVERA